MNENLVEIIKPGLHLNLNAYWAMHYCSILETLYEQKTMPHGFNRPYMENVEPTLGNLAAKAGFAFFNEIKNSLQNFGLQALLCHYLTSDEGKPIFNDIVSKLSELHNFDFVSKTQEYGVHISCKDFNSGLRFAQAYNPYLLGYGKLQHQDVASKVAYADLCILLKQDDENYGILGEVEGNHGGELLLDSFWNRKKGEYYSFGFGVKQRIFKRPSVISGKIEPEPPQITGRWVMTDYGWKYVVMIESDHSIVQDFHGAIGTIQMFMTLGPQQRANYDSSLLPVLNLIKQNWDNNVLDLISNLRSLLVSNKLATLGVNPLPAKIIPSIII
ncbi:hypothetical protein [Vibrio sp.]|uniref:hypothetical protein n=1 Tax=Vibrio sp. TaxID=678 RepID=UPI00311DAA46